MDVVYPVRPGDSNEELRYSLRSLERFPRGTVWIVGHRPEWVRNAEHLETRQNGSKWDNARRNIVAACEHPRISEDFVLMNDDFFFLRRMQSIPTYNRGPIADVLKRYKRLGARGQYVRGIRKTLDLVSSFTDTPISYELHMPMVVRKDRFLEAMAIKGADDTGIQVRSLYGNHAGIGGETIADCKINDRRRSINTEMPFASTSDYSFTHGRAGKQIRDMFPEPSRYER